MSSKIKLEEHLLKGDAAKFQNKYDELLLC